GAARARGVAALLGRGLNCPVTTSAGRWFDAAAAALGLCLVQNEEAEAAIALQRCAEAAVSTSAQAAEAGVRVVDGRIDLRPLLAQLFELADQDRVAEGAALFHAVLAASLVRAALAVRMPTVVLGGGCFFNPLLKSAVAQPLAAAGVRVIAPAHCGDAALALGQAWVAQCRLAARAPAQEESACA
ncbi:MAG: carbamoyltransferase HypF, partial [Burkholderiales bacterium]|nr:carbamoyltransferase HypF [Burkholderiales bacterium]